MKRIPRLVLVLGVAAIAFLASRDVARDVTLVYALPAGEEAASLEVDVLQGDVSLRHAEFRLAGQAAPQVTHAVRLRDGEYRLDLRIDGGPGRIRRVTLPLTVAGSGTVVLPVPARAHGGD